MSDTQRNQADRDDIAYIGQRQNWGGTESFGLCRADRRQHVYAVGKTGTGKTTLLRNLILQDIYAGNGVGVIDPHGDLAQDILDHIPRWRTDDVVYFDPADLEYPVGFNLLQRVPLERRHRIASGLISAMRAIWRDSWGPRLEYILYAAVAALLDCENVSILGIQRMLVDRRYRRWVVEQVRDPLVRSFWVDEFDHYDIRYMREAIAPVQNKVGQLLMSPPVRNVLGQVKRKVDPRFMMDNRRIFIANLSKGQVGEDKANLLGSVLVTSFELAALERVDVPEERREDFFLYIDEFHNFTTDSFATILSEARKYRLCLTLSHQYLDQIHERIRKAVFGNIGTMVSFRVGESDAQMLSNEYGNVYTPAQFSSLDNYEVLVKLLSGGQVADPFRGMTHPPLELRSGRRDRVVRSSREKYASRRDLVEEKIDRWMGR
jgi:TraM recognition site of TraD and TraG/Type IV secretion-system coupling protein DNA-binding domain